MIKVRFEVINIKEQIQVIESFLASKNQMSEFIAKFFQLDISNVSKYEIKTRLTEIYNERIKDLENSKNKFQKVWNENYENINNELIKIFGREFNFECIAYVNLNPIWPRYLDSKCFDVNLDASNDYLLLASTHEIVHFIWFEFWKENFPKIDKKDYDYPNLSWLISEMAIEPIFRFSNLKELSVSNPAYDYFYVDKIKDKTVAEIVNDIFKESKDINDFQINVYNFFKNNKETKKLIK